MNTPKIPKKRLFEALLAGIFAVFLLFSHPNPVSAVDALSVDLDSSSTATENTREATNSTTENVASERICSDESGALGWLVCPGTGVISKTIDGVYSMINDFLVVDPIKNDSTSPVSIIWDYVRDLTNIIFIIFILVVIYSQITGIGISNYGIKRTLPRIIIIAILVNLSFFLCQVLIDASNIAGSSFRDLFSSIQESILSEGFELKASLSWSTLTEALITGGSLAALGIVTNGGLAATFWTLLPILVGAAVSVFIGLVTIAMRQAVIILLVMVSPLALVCYLLPNTEIWFKKWKDLLFRMLIFYPMFSFLYGASALIGWAIMAASDTTLGVIIGLAVQVYPLFASWSLMKLSGTILGDINSRLSKMASRPLGALSRSSASHAAYHQAKYLASRPKGIGQKALQDIQDTAARRSLDTKQYLSLAANRAQARAAKVTDASGRITRRAEELEDIQNRNLEYSTIIAKSQHDYSKGLSQLENVKIGSAQMDRLKALDANAVKASDTLKYELARGAQIEYRNTVGYENRVQSAIDAHMDAVHAGNSRYNTHDMSDADRAAALSRYSTMKGVMEGHTEDIHFIGADAAQIYGAQTGAIQKKYQAYFDLTAPTQDVIHRLNELTSLRDSTHHIDEIIAGLRTLNMRGDTDLVKDVLDATLVDEATGRSKVKLGTYASQSLANFLMFDVKNSDPFLRRFGKYINLETARVYNEADYSKRRHNDDLTFDEYVTGEYKEYDENGNAVEGHSKRTAKILLEGTSFKDIERTGYANLVHSITKACTDKNGHVDHEKSEKLQDEILNATLANLIGDSLTYLSGSEQITSFTQFITGIKKGKNGYEEDFLDLDTSSDDFKNMSKEEQDALLAHKREYYQKRTKFFIENHVPNQMGRFKSDIFAGARQMYRNMAESNLTDAERREYEALTDKSAKEAYLDEHGAKSYFKSAIRPKTYEYLQKMYNRGYLSDAKAPISAYLDLDKQAVPVDNNDLDDEDEESAGPAPTSPDGPAGAPSTSVDEAILASVDIELDSFTRAYSNDSNRHRVADYLNDIVEMLSTSGIDDSIVTRVSGLSRELSVHTDISTLHEEIYRILHS